MKTEVIKISKVKTNPSNPRLIKDDKYRKLVKSIREFPEMLHIRPIVVNDDMIVLGGNMRLRACQEAGLKEVPVIKASQLSEKQQREFIIKDNVGFGEWDWDDLANEWDVEELEDWGLDLPLDMAGDNDEQEVHGKLQDTFLVPPFSVLDTRQGYWNDRKRYWKQLINDNGESREGALSEAELMSGINNGVSILDPLIAELAVKWFCTPQGSAFDCFAGDSVFGYVSSYCGHKFTGIELRQEQADLNNARVKNLTAKYICDDGRNVLNHIKPKSQDLLFSCPPYFDLEVYSDMSNDASNQKSYDDFIGILDTAFSNSIKCLKDNRFAVITLGDVRDKNGYYWPFIDDVKNIFRRNGMPLYNELILVESLGTLPQRAARYMKNRKVGKCHQNVLVFYKGNPKEIKNIYPVITVNESADI